LLDKTEEIVEALIQASNDNNIEEIGKRAHELKGMAGNFGLVEISTIAGAAEKKVKSNEIEGLEDVISGLPNAKERAIEALKDWAES